MFLLLGAGFDVVFFVFLAPSTPACFVFSALAGFLALAGFCPTLVGVVVATGAAGKVATTGAATAGATATGAGATAGAGGGRCGRRHRGDGGRARDAERCCLEVAGRRVQHRLAQHEIGLGVDAAFEVDCQRVAGRARFEVSSHGAVGRSRSVVSATARNLKASATRYTLAVNLKCGVNAETDLVLGEAVLYPPTGDLQALPFRVACPAAAVAPVPAAPAPGGTSRRRSTGSGTGAGSRCASRSRASRDAVPGHTGGHNDSDQKGAKAGQRQEGEKHVEVLGAKKTKKNNVKPSAKKKKHGGVLGAKKSKNLPFTK